MRRLDENQSSEDVTEQNGSKELGLIRTEAEKERRHNVATNGRDIEPGQYDASL